MKPHLNVSLIIPITIIIIICYLQGCTTEDPTTTTSEPPKPIDDLKICYRDDPNLNDCLKDSIQSFLPKLSTELPSFNLPRMDPYVTEDAKLNYSVIDAFVGKLSVYEVYAHGLSRGQVKSVTANITSKNAMKLSINVWFPEGRLTGNYEGLTRVGFIPFESGGPFRVNLTDVTLNWRIKGKVRRVKGVEYMKIRSFKFQPTEIGNMRIKMDGIFPSKQLTKSTVKLINGSWGFFTRQLMPETQNYFGPELVKVLNKIFMKVPYDQLLPKGYKGGGELEGGVGGEEAAVVE